MIDASLRHAAKAIGKYCETVTCEACPYYQENHPSGVVCGLNAPRIKREYEEWVEYREEHKVGRPAGKKAQRKRTQHLHISLSDAEKEVLKAQADKYGISVSMLLRDTVEMLKRKKK